MNLLELLIVILIVAWLAGAWVVPSNAIHLLLVVVLVLVVVRLAQGRSVS